MPISGKQAIKTLQRHGFVVSRQQGSHIVLIRIRNNRKRTAVVPNHKELRRGTLSSIARQSGLNKKELGL
ncbi:MAG: type II toxin-antitoxin system HicA family toxin [bacterium]|nr:type II toxin-antitoxin system HicA family toxin [bacterium]